jgi:hypothetical protein
MVEKCVYLAAFRMVKLHGGWVSGPPPVLDPDRVIFQRGVSGANYATSKKNHKKIPRKIYKYLI